MNNEQEIKAQNTFNKFRTSQQKGLFISAETLPKVLIKIREIVSKMEQLEPAIVMAVREHNECSRYDHDILEELCDKRELLIPAKVAYIVHKYIGYDFNLRRLELARNLIL